MRSPHCGLVGARVASVAFTFPNKCLQVGLFKCELHQFGESRADAEGDDACTLSPRGQLKSSPSSWVPGSSSLLQMLRTASEYCQAPVTPHIPAVAPAPRSLAPFCPPSTSPLRHSKEGTHQPQEKHRGEEKGLSWALLPARGGTCPPRARTQTFLPMGTAGLDVSLAPEPALPGPGCQPHKHCHGATG